MKDTMRQLLGRKSNIQRLSDPDTTNSRSTAKLLPGDTGERVFPIRSQRGNVDTSWLAHTTRVDNSICTEGHTGSSTVASRGDDSPSSSKTGSSHGDRWERRKIAETSKVIFLNSGPINVLSGSAIGKDGSPYRRCEDEPIHTPGAIQSYGALLGLKYGVHGQLEVRIASENTRKILGYGPEHLFRMSSFLEILRPDGRGEMTARINHALRKVDALKEETRLDVFQIFLTFPYEPEIRLWCALHLAPSPANMVILEFEEYLDAFYLNDMRVAKTLPESPIRHMDFDVTPEEFEKSTAVASKPLPVLEIARTRQNKEFSSLDVFNAMSQAQQQISRCHSVQELMEVTVGIVAELTGFHRVMFYRFDERKNGCVDAELVNPRACIDVFRGMHFPAADIPEQARALYIINRIRILHDRVSENSRLVCRDEKDSEVPLDLTHAYLRAMSPVHSKYLENMSVRSTLSISIVIDSDLWGLVACHGYGDAGIRVSLPIRELLRNIGECASTNIKQLIMRQRLEVRRPPPANPISQTPSSYLAASATDLLKLVDADFALLSIEEESRAIGRLDPYQEALAIMEYLQTCRFTEVRSSININADFPGIMYPPGIKTIAGLLVIPFNIGELNDYMVFFRKGQLREVKWAGNPYDKTFKPGSEYLDPRMSFQRWTETIVGTCREWTADQLDTALILSLLYGRFVEIWRQRGSMTQGNKMSLIRNSSRDLRTPLNTITGYLEMALENKVDSKTRHFLSRAQEASNSMAAAVDSLSKLTNAEEGAVPVVEETFNLNLTASKITKALQKEANRKALDLTILIHEQLPAMVRGDADQFRHFLAQLTSNAFMKATSVRVDLNLLSTKDDTSVVGLRVQNSGPGMTEAELDSTFQDLEQAHNDDDWLFASEDSASRSTAPNSEGSADLAVIGRYVRDVNGQIRVTSEVGKGTIFSIELPFEHVRSTGSSTMPRRLRNLFSVPSNTTKDKRQAATKTPKQIITVSDSQRQRKIEASIPTATYPEFQSFPRNVDQQPVAKDNDHKSRIGKNKPCDFEYPSSPHVEEQTKMKDSTNTIHTEEFRAAVIHAGHRSPPGIDREANKTEIRHSPRNETYETAPYTQFPSSSRMNIHSLSSENDKDRSPKPKTLDNITPPHAHSNISLETLREWPRVGSESSKNAVPSYESKTDSMQRQISSSQNPSSGQSGIPETEIQIQVPSFSLNMLIADDNFATQRVLDKQLSQLGHLVTIACDGQEAHDRFVSSSAQIDIVLMDLKMPQVDGILSTRMIRFWEKESKRRRPSMLPPNARESDPSPKPRVPIIAVSASLSEDGRFECIGNSFDGWLMKPIDFATLELLLMGVKDRGMKRDALYMPGRIGGWFFP